MSLRSASRLAATCARLRAWQIGQCPALQHAQTSEHTAAAAAAAAQPSWFIPRRDLHFSASVLAVEDVLVPSMGDSITEGTIVNVSKAAGDSVAEDEVIAQIETDKVTIDVRAPHAGTISDILVKDDDNVEVGQVVAKLDSEGGAAASKSEGAQPDAQQPQPQQQKQSAPEAESQDIAAKIGGQPSQQARPQPSGRQDPIAQGHPDKPHRVGIAFPPRRTADGTRISSLPVAEAQRALSELAGAPDSAAAPPDSGAGGLGEPTTDEEAASEMEGVRLRRWAVGGQLPLDEDWMPAPGKWALSEREMEMIDLGGADP